MAYRASCARPSTPDIRTDLLTMLNTERGYNLVLRYDNCYFRVHRSIVRTRSVYIRHLIDSNTTDQVDVHLPRTLPHLSESQFRSLLRYLYCNELDDELRIRCGNDRRSTLFTALIDHLIVPKQDAFDYDLSLTNMQSINGEGDATLVFSTNNSHDTRYA